MKNKFAENLRQYRGQAGMTQEELGEALGVSSQTVSRWEKAVNYPDVELLPALAALFGISMEELMGVTFNENHIAVQQCMKRAYQVEDRAERQRILRQFHHHHPTSDFVTANLARESDNPEEVRKLVHFLSDRVARGLTKKLWLDIALEALVEKETDENLPETLNEYTESIQNSREYRLASRYTARQQDDQLRALRQTMLLEALRNEHLRYVAHLKNHLAEISPQEVLHRVHTDLAMINLCTGCPESRVSGDGTADAWVLCRLRLGIMLSAAFSALERTGEALTAWEETAELFAALCKCPQNSLLSFRCPQMDCLTARLLSDREWISIDPIDHVYLSTGSVDRLFAIRMAGQYGEWLGDLVHHPRWVAAEEKIRSAAG